MSVFANIDDTTQHYALLSPDARWVENRIVTAAPPAAGDPPTIIRTIKLTEPPFAPLFQKLDAFGELSEDWDSYGAARISSRSIATARALMSDVSLRTVGGLEGIVPISIAPVATGGVKIEWHRPDAALELWIDDEGRIERLLDRKQDHPRFDAQALSGIPAAVSEVLTFCRLR